MNIHYLLMILSRMDLINLNTKDANGLNTYGTVSYKI